jgi:anti-sigma factor RsiW
MTCREALLLLDEFVDQELPPARMEAVAAHLAQCRSCRDEVETTIKVKEMLRQKSVYSPGEDYWNETASLILARTVESPLERIPATSESRTVQRHAFIRSVVSVFASLVILFTALLIGSNKGSDFVRLTAPESPLFSVAPIQDMVGSDNTVIVTRAERLSQAKGMLLMGSPGFLGRFALMYEMDNLPE